MKRISIVLLIASLIANSFGNIANAQKGKKTPSEIKTTDAEIEIWLKGAPAGKVRLFGIWGSYNMPEDSTIADQTGKCVFIKSTPYEAGMYYAVYADNSYLTVLLDKNQHLYVHSEKGDSVIQKATTNSLECRLFYENLLFESLINNELNRIKKEKTAATAGTKTHDSLDKIEKKLIDERKAKIASYKTQYPDAFFTKFKIMGQNPELPTPRKPDGSIDADLQLRLYRESYWNGYDFSDARLLRTPVYFNKLTSFMKLYVQTPDSLLLSVQYIMPKTEANPQVFKFTSNFLAMMFRQSKIMGGEKIYVWLVENYFTYEKAYWSDSTNTFRVRDEARRMKPSLLGATGGELFCPDTAGNNISLYQMSQRFTVVYMYNPDCELCQKETPKLKKVYDEWKAKGMVVYALNVEHDREKWLAYINKLGLDWINVWDPKYQSRYYDKYFVTTTPGIYVLDQNHQIISTHLGADMLPALFERELEKK